ncbi:phospholipase C/P1 nuclease domain-containing protein [Mycena leptocephala]|nr:phospholipase C/P1 nuclease domain-containing protein [Mycena leptocephala]
MPSYVLLTLLTLQGARAWGTLATPPSPTSPRTTYPTTAAWAKTVLNDTSTSYLANIASWADTYRRRPQARGRRRCTLSTPRTTLQHPAASTTHATAAPPAAPSPPSQTTPSAPATAASAPRTSPRPCASSCTSSATSRSRCTTRRSRSGEQHQGHVPGLCDNLHADWDTYMPETLVGGSTLADAKSWATTLTADIDSGAYSSAKASWIAGDTISDPVTTATRWAADANAFVCSKVMPEGAAALTAEADLYPTYYDAVIPTIELQIAKGGYRLGIG